MLAGVAVFAALTAQVGAQSSGPSVPGYYVTITAQAVLTSQAGGNAPTGTSTVIPTPTQTATVVGTSPTATIPVSGQQTSPNTIANGRGRIANVKDRGFSVVWTTDTESTGGINYGSNASLGSPAPDQRGTTYSGVTHYVDVGNLQPNTTYFFDLLTGTNVDNNNGQHYQVKTGPDIGQPSTNAYLAGGVSNPGGGSPAGFAIIWGVVRDTDNKPTGGSSQLLASFAGPDGRFQMSIVPRTADLGAFYQFSNQGDTIDLTGRAANGEKTVQIDTSILQSGGSAPADARVVLEAIGTTVATATPTSVNTTVPQSPTAIPTQTLGPFASVTPRPNQPATPTMIPVFPPPAPAPDPRAPEQLPVQLPPLREMQIVPPIGTAIVTTTDGRVPTGGESASARPVDSAPRMNNVVPNAPGTAPLVAPAPGTAANVRAGQSVPAGSVAPSAPPDTVRNRNEAPNQPSAPIQAPLNQGNPVAGSPPVLPSSAGAIGNQGSADAVSSRTVAQAPATTNLAPRAIGNAPVNGTSFANRGAELGQVPATGRTTPADGRGINAGSAVGDRGNGATGSLPAQPPSLIPGGGWLDGLMTMHPVISLLFYGGLK